jgi:hypothetical protein
MTFDGMNTASLRAVLASQYHASLAMLRQAITLCPEGLWTDTRLTNRYWQIAYHTLFFTHLYLMRDESAFVPWEHARSDYESLGSLPYPPHELPKIGEPYSKAEILEYWAYCDALVDAALAEMDLAAPECGFWWYKMSKLEHQLTNIRHNQHHTAQLADRLRNEAGIGIDWIGDAQRFVRDVARR